MNKLLHRQLQKHFDKEEQVPENLTRLLNVISDSYDHYEKDRKLTERSIELSSKEMIELNSQVKAIGKAEVEKVYTQLKMLFENIEEVFYSVDVVKLKIVEMSAACEKVYGYSPAEFLDDRILWYKIILPEDIHLVDHHFKELYQGKPVVSQYRIVHKDKSIRWLESKVIPLLDEMGQLIWMNGVTNDITERKNSEAGILNAYEDMNTVLERIDDGFFAVDTNSIVTYWNKRAEILLGAKKEDVIGKNLHEVFAATASNVFYNHYQKAIRENRTIHFEEFSTRTNKWFAVSAFASDNGLSVYFKDITERKESENKIKESELRYRSLIEQATDAICIADMFMKIIDINPSGCQLLGYSKEEFLQLSIADLFIQEELKANPFKMDELKAGKAVRNERRLKRKDGTIVEVELNAKLLDDGRFTLFARDITERKRGEKLLKENELRYRSLIEQATDAICIADRSLEFIDVNPYACEFLGYTKEEALKLFVSDIIFPEDLATNPINNFETIKPNEIIRNERRLKRKDGSAVIMEVSTRLMEDGRLMIFGHDVSARKRAEEIILRSEASLNLMNKELELKNTELEHFAYIVSHDLQEPLRTTSSFVDLLQKQFKGKLDAKADKYLHFITDSTERMKILITDLLDYSRIGYKRELQQVDGNAVLNELLQDLGTTLKETGAVIKVESLPVIYGFKTEVKQLFQNLIVNAIKFRKKDTIPQISISAQKDKNNWTFAIQDNGIGMEEEHTDRIFVIFQRLHTRTEYEGSGIGLAHCKKIVGLHGGDIWVKSHPGEGATFYFTIPLN